MIPGQPFGVGRTHHLCGFAAKRGCELFRADFAILGNNDADWIAVHLGHQSFQHALRRNAERLRGLQTDVVSIGVIFVAVQHEFQSQPLQRHMAIGVYFAERTRDGASSRSIFLRCSMTMTRSTVALQTASACIFSPLSHRTAIVVGHGQLRLRGRRLVIFGDRAVWIAFQIIGVAAIHEIARPFAGI
jgi:hypothetical protein